MFFDWKIQLEKIQLTRDLKDNTINYQGIRLLVPCLVSRRHLYNISSSKNTHSNDKIS